MKTKQAKKRSVAMTPGSLREWRRLMETICRDAGTAVLRQFHPDKAAMDQILAGRDKLKTETIEFVLDTARQLVGTGKDLPANSISVAKAQEMMGPRFFGFDDYQALGIVVPRGLKAKVAQFPWSLEVLNSSCPFYAGKKVCETHVAFLGLEQVAKKRPLTIREWQNVCPASGQPRFYSYPSDCWYTNEEFANKPTCELRWYLALAEIVPNSESKIFEDQQRMMPVEYEVSSPVVEVTKHLLYRRKLGQYPNLYRWGATNALDSNGCRVLVGYCSGGTLDVRHWDGPRNDRVGLAVLRKVGA